MSDEMPNAAPVAGVLAGHGLFLAGCGIYGAKASGWSAMHSMYAGLGGCAVLTVSSLLSVGGTKKLYMIGVHVGLLAQLLFTVVFGVQSYKSYEAYLTYMIITTAMGTNRRPIIL